MTATDNSPLETAGARSCCIHQQTFRHIGGHYVRVGDFCLAPATKDKLESSASTTMLCGGDGTFDDSWPNGSNLRRQLGRPERLRAKSSVVPAIHQDIWTRVGSSGMWVASCRGPDDERGLIRLLVLPNRCAIGRSTMLANPMAHSHSLLHQHTLSPQ